MFSRLKILLFLFLLSHSNCLNLKRLDKNLTTYTSQAILENNHFTTELHKIVRWKSQPSFYTAPMEYQEIVAVPTTEEITTEVSTTMSQNITVQYWTPVFSSSASTSPPEITEFIYEPRHDQGLKPSLGDIGDVGTSNITFKAIMKEDAKDICPHFIYSKQAFNLEPMADVWQTSYFSLPSKIQCFKILIRKITEKEKKQYSRRFGSFNGVVNWAECNLEIWSALQNGRKHFLQGLNEDDGIMDNIIIEDPEGTNVETLSVIHEESADQWLVYKNLLLLRDCDNGGIVVFSKFPLKPSKTEVEEAIEVFGEPTFNGQMACEQEEDVHEGHVVGQKGTKWLNELVKAARSREMQAPKDSSWLYSMGGAYTQKWPSSGL